MGIPIHWCYLEKWGKKALIKMWQFFSPINFFFSQKVYILFLEKVKVEVVTKYSPILLYWGHNLDVKKTIKKEVRDSDQEYFIHSFIHSVSTTTATAAAPASISRPPRLPCDSCVLHPLLFAYVFLPQGSSAGSRLVHLQRSFETGTHLNDASILGRS